MEDLLELLWLHVAAVWYVPVPARALGDVTLPSGGPLPPWALYVGALAEGQVRLWRPDVREEARPGLVARADAALQLPVNARAGEGVEREVAFALKAEPQIDLEAARRSARPLTPADAPLLAAFDPGEGAYRDPVRWPVPLIGVVAEGRLACVAHSSRRTDRACELGIDTVPEARRRGYALAATVLWTALVAAEGRVPLYSALEENAASLALAHAAGYRPFVRAACITL